MHAVETPHMPITTRRIPEYIRHPEQEDKRLGANQPVALTGCTLENASHERVAFQFLYWPHDVLSTPTSQTPENRTLRLLQMGPTECPDAASPNRWTLGEHAHWGFRLTPLPQHSSNDPRALLSGGSVD
jgi:hypothetical protein